MFFQIAAVWVFKCFLSKLCFGQKYEYRTSQQHFTGLFICNWTVTLTRCYTSTLSSKTLCQKSMYDCSMHISNGLDLQNVYFSIFDWREKKIEGLTFLRGLTQYHSDILLNRLHDVCLALIQEVRPRLLILLVFYKCSRETAVHCPGDLHPIPFYS